VEIAGRRREEEIVLGGKIDEAETAKTPIVISACGVHGDRSGRSAKAMMILNDFENRRRRGTGGFGEGKGGL